MLHEISHLQTNNISPLSTATTALGPVTFTGTFQTAANLTRHVDATPAVVLSPANPATFAVYDSPLACYHFANGASNSIDAMCELPNNWIAGTAIVPKIRISIPAAAVGTVRLVLTSTFTVESGDPTAHSVITTDVDVGAYVADQMHTITLTSLATTGLTLPKVIVLHLERAGGSDTYASPMQLHAVGFDYSINSL
ncbi:MAG: hypothetical protein PHN45_01985 [Methylococcales bacterium]|nr:hypothetical protein [Methylococcales bacterium]